VRSRAGGEGKVGEKDAEVTGYLVVVGLGSGRRGGDAPARCRGGGGWWRQWRHSDESALVEKVT